MPQPYSVLCAVCRAHLDKRRTPAQPDGRYRCARCQAFADRLAPVREAAAAARQAALAAQHGEAWPVTAPFTAGPAYIPVRARPLGAVHLVQTADDNPFLSTRGLRALCGSAAAQWDRAARAQVTCVRCLQARDWLEAAR